MTGLRRSLGARQRDIVLVHDLQIAPQPLKNRRHPVEDSKISGTSL